MTKSVSSRPVNFYVPILSKPLICCVTTQVDRFKAVFKGDDCLIPGPYAVVRDISAVCNNVDNPFGIAHIPLKTVAGNGFGDGQSTFGGSTISARLISNIVCSEGEHLRYLFHWFRCLQSFLQ